ncbi:MAG: NAD(P)H-dependent oxidoreductase [Alphaproteobacteria bacterium]
MRRRGGGVLFCTQSAAIGSFEQARPTVLPCVSTTRTSDRPFCDRILSTRGPGRRTNRTGPTQQARVDRNAAVAFIFQVWGWSVPATTKGWIDRDWNRGWACGSRKLPIRKARMLAL